MARSARGKAAVAHEMRMHYRAEPSLTGHVSGYGVRRREALARQPRDKRGAGSPGSIHPASAFGAGNLGLGPAVVRRGDFEAREHDSLRRQGSDHRVSRGDRGLVPEDLTGGQSEKTSGTR